MGKKNRSSDEKIWSKQFGENYDNIEYVSRSERSKIERNRDGDRMSPMLTGTVIFLALLILGTIFYYIWFSNRSLEEQLFLKESEVETVQKTEKKSESESELEEKLVEKPDSEPEPEEKLEEKPKPEPEPELEEKPEKKPEPEPKPEEKPKPEPEPEAAPTSEPEETPEVNSPAGTGATYTVQPGDNMYRIALNHGLTTGELMALNQLTEETVYVGQVLQIE